jgi:hypothetical protein
MFWRETGAGGLVVNENVVAVLQFGTWLTTNGLLAG